MDSFVSLKKQDLEDFVSNGFEMCSRLIFKSDSNQELVGLAQFELLDRLRIDAHLNVKFPFNSKVYHAIQNLNAERRHIYKVEKELQSLDKGVNQ